MGPHNQQLLLDLDDGCNNEDPDLEERGANENAEDIDADDADDEARGGEDIRQEAYLAFDQDARHKEQGNRHIQLQEIVEQLKTYFNQFRSNDNVQRAILKEMLKC